MISPDRTGSDRTLESPVMFGRNSRNRRSFEDRNYSKTLTSWYISLTEGGMAHWIAYV
mgnify:FL=1